jgi:GntR family transcriptional regulator, transcriptional repressor for pyruvate dehydrogenase complex
MRYSRQKSLKDISQQDLALRQHKQIFMAIKDQDIAKTGVTMQKHILGLSAAVEEQANGEE